MWERLTDAEVNYLLVEPAQRKRLLQLEYTIKNG